MDTETPAICAEGLRFSTFHYVCNCAGIGVSMLLIMCVCSDNNPQALWTKRHSSAGPNTHVWVGICHGGTATAVFLRVPRMSRFMSRYILATTLLPYCSVCRVEWEIILCDFADISC